MKVCPGPAPVAEHVAVCRHHVLSTRCCLTWHSPSRSAVSHSQWVSHRATFDLLVSCSKMQLQLQGTSLPVTST